MSLAWAFFKRDALIALSYRTSMIAQLSGNLILLGIFYFIGQLIGKSDNPALAQYGGSYLPFMLIGLALADTVGVSLTTFATQIREGQLTGTLEATLMSPVRLALVLIYSSLWSYFFSALRFLLYIGVGSLLYDVSMADANLLSVMTIFLLTVLCFAGVGILWASVVMLLKRGESVLTMVGLIVIVLSGVLFPRDVLPTWMQYVAEVIPLSHALDGMRLAMLTGADLYDLSIIILKLGAFALVLLPLGIYAFNAAVDIAKRSGSLVEY